MGRIMGESYASQARREGRLWPQVLTDRELLEEWDRTDPKQNPISARMLREELERRGKR